MGYKTPHLCLLTIQTGNLGAPAVLTTYYGANMNVGFSTAAAAHILYFPFPCRITGAQWFWQYSNNPTNEDVNTYIRIDDSTDYLIETKGLAAAGNTTFENLNLNIPVNNSNFMQVKTVTPNWVTPPTSLRTSGNLILLFD